CARYYGSSYLDYW
nr:immunoglobulin heavy chain junction region [Mus musculus]